MLVKEDSVETITESEYEKIYDKTTKTFDDDFIEELRKLYTRRGFDFILPRKKDGVKLVWQREFPRVKMECETYFCVSGEIYTPAFSTEKPKTCWADPCYANPEYGTEFLKNLFNNETRNIISKATPKSVYTVEQFIRMNSTSLVLDYFAGSGTTGHAVINLNREDGGKRKYILVEMGAHFETVLKPRIEKVVYSPDWKNGVPEVTDKGISHAFKYLTLESYEDTLNNLELDTSAGDAVPATLRDEYLLRYSLDIEARANLLSTADFQKPFDYKLKIAADTASSAVERKIDLVETFNYLIGLCVETLSREEEKGVACVTGTLPSGERSLIIWRDCEKIDNAALNKIFEKNKFNVRDSEFDVVFVNGDHALENLALDADGNETDVRRMRVRQIEDAFLDAMFADDE